MGHSPYGQTTTKNTWITGTARKSAIVAIGILFCSGGFLKRLLYVTCNHWFSDITLNSFLQAFGLVLWSRDGSPSVWADNYRNQKHVNHRNQIHHHGHQHLWNSSFLENTIAWVRRGYSVSLEITVIMVISHSTCSTCICFGLLV